MVSNGFKMNNQSGLFSMKKKTIVLLAMAVSFGSGFVFSAALNKTSEKQTKAQRVTGIGGIFFKCKDPEKLKQWYQTHLGFDINEFGAMFAWCEEADSSKTGYTVWSPFSDSTDYFEPSSKDFIINYRVEDLEGLVSELQNEGVTVLDSIETYDFGKFVHILDLEGNKIELWEPTD